MPFRGADKGRCFSCPQEKEIKEVTASCNKGFPVHDGAFIHSLEQELGGMHVHREAYYGGTFTGNSAHRCLKVIEEIYI